MRMTTTSMTASSTANTDHNQKDSKQWNQVVDDDISCRHPGLILVGWPPKGYHDDRIVQHEMKGRTAAIIAASTRPKSSRSKTRSSKSPQGKNNIIRRLQEQSPVLTKLIVFIHLLVFNMAARSHPRFVGGVSLAPSLGERLLPIPSFPAL